MPSLASEPVSLADIIVLPLRFGCSKMARLTFSEVSRVDRHGPRMGNSSRTSDAAPLTR